MISYPIYKILELTLEINMFNQSYSKKIHKKTKNLILAVKYNKTKFLKKYSHISHKNTSTVKLKNQIKKEVSLI
jgi:hypothetical protein